MVDEHWRRGSVGDQNGCPSVVCPVFGHAVFGHTVFENR